MINRFNVLKNIGIKPESSIPKNLIDKVDLILLNKRDEWKIFGSSMYRIQRYYGDIDVRETYVDNKSIEDILNKAAKTIKKIVRDINSTPISYFSEFKAGLDLRYDIDIGKPNNGIYYPLKEAIAKIKRLYKQKLLNDTEYKTLIEILKLTETNANNYDICYNILRERRILRWTSKEVIQGYKILPNGVIMNLVYAMGMKTHIKIDYITVSNGNFIEITNIIFLGKINKNKNGSIIDFINVDDNYNSSHVYVKQMREEIEKLFYSDFYFSLFKCMKRVFALTKSFYKYALDINDSEKINYYGNIILELSPIISGDISSLYQIKSFLSSIKRLYELKVSIPEELLMKQLYSIQFNITNLLFIKNDDFINFNKIISIFEQDNNISSRQKLISALDNYFQHLTNQRTLFRIDEFNFNPLPEEFVPLFPIYNHEKIKLYLDDVLTFKITESKDGFTYIKDNHGELILKTSIKPKLFSFPKEKLSGLIREKNFDSYELELKEKGLPNKDIHIKNINPYKKYVREKNKNSKKKLIDDLSIIADRLTKQTIVKLKDKYNISKTLEDEIYENAFDSYLEFLYSAHFKNFIKNSVDYELYLDHITRIIEKEQKEVLDKIFYVKGSGKRKLKRKTKLRRRSKVKLDEDDSEDEMYKQFDKTETPEERYAKYIKRIRKIDIDLNNKRFLNIEEERKKREEENRRRGIII